MSKAKTTLRERLKVATYIQANPTATSEEVQVATKVKKSLTGIRKWISQKGIEEYVAMITLLRNAERKRKQVARRKKAGKPVTKLGEFTNQKGEKKNIARNKMVNAIANSGIKKGKVLTLPNEDWTIERMLNEYVSKVFNYEAVEWNLGIFNTMSTKKDLYGQSNNVHYGSVSDHILPMGADTYSHMILDYCGTLETFKKEIVHAMMNNLVVKGGTIAITVGKACNFSPTVGKVNRLRNKIAGFDVSMYDDTCKTTVYIEMFFKMFCSVTEFEVVESLEYGDSSPMMLTILRRKS